MKFKFQYLHIKNNMLTVFFSNKKRDFSTSLSFSAQHPQYATAVDLVKEVSATDLYKKSLKVSEVTYETFKELNDLYLAVSTWSDGSLSITREGATFEGKVLERTLSDFLVNKFLEDPKHSDFKTWSRFVKAVQTSSSDHVFERMFLFISQNDLHLTQDGEHILAWKVVTPDYMDKYTRTFDNSVGATPSVPRNQVEADPNKACSKGLHIASMDYLNKCYSRHGDRLMIVKVPLANIVSIPFDYEGSKVRCSGYEVVGDAGVWGVDVDGQNYPDLSQFGAVPAY